MIINKIEMTNFGRHEHLTFESAGTIAGIIGKNASGKSTVVAFLKWMLNNILPDANQTYIRNASTETKRGHKATGKLWLSTGGHNVIISRELLMSGGSKVELTVDDDEPIKSQKEAEARLQELFGTDRRAVDALMVIQQGALGDMVLGTPAARYETFSKFLDMTHLPTCEKRVDEGIKRLSERTIDYTPDKLQATIKLEEAKEKLKAKESDLGNYRDTTEHLKGVTAAINLRTVERELEKSYLALQQSADTLDKDEQAFTAANPDSQESRLAKQDELRKTVNSLDDSIKKQGEIAADSAALASAESSVVRLRQDADNRRASVAVVLTDMAVRLKTAARDRCEEMLRDIPRIKQALSARDSALQTLKDAESTLATLLPEDKTRETLENELNQASAAESNAAFVISVLQPMKHGGPCSASCPVCGGSSVPSSDELTAKLAFQESIRASSATQRQALRQLLDRHTQQMQAVYTASALVASCEDAVKELPADYEQTIQDEDRTRRTLAELKAELEADNVTRGNNAAALVAATNLDTKIEGLQATIAVLKNKLAGVEKSDVSVSELQTKKAAVEQELATLRNIIGEYDRIEARKTVRHSLGDTRSKWEDAVASVDKALVDLGVERANVDASLQAMYDKLWTEGQCHRDLKAQIEADKGTVKHFEDEIRRIEENMKRVEAGRQKIVKLRELKEALGRNGAPGAFLSEVYKRVLARTQFYLSQMRSTFTVQIDPEESLNFKFKDFNNMDGGLQPPSKLSGAQRVRMGLAFVLALHDLVVPGLGLLVLDEPSNHMDEASKEDLRDLFVQLEPILASRRSQLWVVDHSPVLQQAFTKMLQLGA